MTRIKDEGNLLLMHKLSNGGRTNLFEFRFENIVDEFCEEKDIEEHTSFDNVK
jgi:hypothetical protein